MQQAQQLVDKIVLEIVNPIVAVLFTLAVVVFFWGLIEFIYKAGDASGREIGKQHMVWGLVGIFIMMSAYGILKLFTNAFDIPLNY